MKGDRTNVSTTLPAVEVSRKSRRIFIRSRHLLWIFLKTIPNFVVLIALIVTIYSLYNADTIAAFLSLSGFGSFFGDREYSKELLSKSPIYRCYFPNISTENARDVLAIRFLNATSMKLPAKFPQRVIKIKFKFSTEKRISKHGYKYVRYVNPLCLFSRTSTDQVCFNTLSNSFFSGSGVAIDTLSSSLYEMGGGCCMYDWNFFTKKKIKWSPRKTRESFSKNRNSTIIVLCQHHGTTYHHIMFEVLPRYFICLPFIDADPAVLVAIDDSDVLFSTLVTLGLDARRIIRVKPSQASTWYGAALLIYPLPILGHEHAYPLINHMQLRAVSDLLKYVTKSQVPKEEKSRRYTLLLMERARKRSWSGKCKEARCLKNFADLKAALASKFPNVDVVVFPAVSTLSQAISAFSSADIVVGIHGAGFQNLMFCKPGTTVVHMGYDVEYHWMANTFKLHFHPVIIKGLHHEARSFEINVKEAVGYVFQAMEQDGRI